MIACNTQMLLVHLHIQGFILFHLIPVTTILGYR